MAYTKQNFTDGQVLNAEHLNKMETAIINLDTGLESTNLSAALAMKGSLKWDGVIGDKEHIFLQYEGGFAMGYVRVGDYPDLSLYSENVDREEIEIFVSINEYNKIISEAMPATLLEDGLLMSEAIVCIPYDNYLLEGLIPFPKKGIYFMAYSALPNGIDISIMYISALSMIGVSFEDSFDKYFQKKTAITKTSDTITWDGNTMGLSNIGNQFFKVSDDVPTLADLQNGGTITMTVDGGTDTVDFTSDDIEISQDGQLILVRDCIHVLPSQLEIYPAGIYFIKINNQYISSFTVNDYKFVVDKKTEEIIKAEHLPEALRFGNNALNSITWNGDATGREIITLFSGLNYVKVSNDLLKEENFFGDFSLTMSTLNGEEQTFGKDLMRYSEDGTGFIIAGEDGDGNISPFPLVKCFYSDDNEYGVSKGTYFININGVYISILSFGRDKIDQKYIPDTVTKHGDKELILTSSTEGSTKQFKITVDDNGTLTATEVAV